jgi:RhoGEF domain
MKETLLLCDQQNPRFHAFLKICQAKPECGRQSLQDLMIRPVQRLPSISLLLNDIMKHTAKSNPDFRKLDDALKTIKEVMKHINEDKRKTEGQVVMFDIFNEIDNCPVGFESFGSKPENYMIRSIPAPLGLLASRLHLTLRSHRTVGKFERARRLTHAVPLLRFHRVVQETVACLQQRQIAQHDHVECAEHDPCAGQQAVQTHQIYAVEFDTFGRRHSGQSAGVRPELSIEPGPEREVVFVQHQQRRGDGQDDLFEEFVQTVGGECVQGGRGRLKSA